MRAASLRVEANAKKVIRCTRSVENIYPTADTRFFGACERVCDASKSERVHKNGVAYLKMYYTYFRNNENLQIILDRI